MATYETNLQWAKSKQYLEAIRRMKAAGGYISFDPNLRDEVWQDPS